MGLLRGMRSIIAFLTRIPAGRDACDLAEAARYMPLFPLVGLFTGFVWGSVTWLLTHFFPTPVAGLLGTGAILLLTGLHHTDGLLDFGDGVMRQGTREEKLGAMRDTQIGAGGFSLGLITLMATALAAGYLRPEVLIQGLTLSEASAKSAMVLASALARSAHEGLGTPFVNAMHSALAPIRVVCALAIPLAAALLLLPAVGLVSIAGSLLCCLIVVGMARRSFGGLTGDVLGAINDLSRMTGLLVMFVVSG